MYVKLFSSILDSSIWAEDAETRLVWITLLAMADKDGYVRSSKTALARRANVSLTACKIALKILASPDQESATQEHEGRRIEEVEGGWILLNYLKYREIRTEEQLKSAARSRAYYHRKKSREGREDSQTSRTEADTEAEADTTKLDSPTENPVSADADDEVSREDDFPIGADEADQADENGSQQEDWKVDAAICLRENGVLPREVGDAIRNFWTQARARFTDHEITQVVQITGARFREKGQTWNPARVWNPRNAEFDERFRWAISQSRQSELRATRQSRGLASVRDILNRQTS